jgi:hypothetical protein
MHGRPIMLFVVAKTARGKLDSKALIALEQYLIGLAFQANDAIQNVHGIPKPLFEIDGVQVPKARAGWARSKSFCKAFRV